MRVLTASQTSHQWSRTVTSSRVTRQRTSLYTLLRYLPMGLDARQHIACISTMTTSKRSRRSSFLAGARARVV